MPYASDTEFTSLAIFLSQDTITREKNLNSCFMFSFIENIVPFESENGFGNGVWIIMGWSKYEFGVCNRNCIRHIALASSTR